LALNSRFLTSNHIVHLTGSRRAVRDPDTLANAFASLNIDNKDSDEVGDDNDEEYEDIE
jgi:hypothetical protein